MNDLKEQQHRQVIIGGHILQYGRKRACPKCGWENDIYAKSCIDCGFKFVGGIMVKDKEPEGYLYTDEDIESMLLHGIVINLAYENYGEQLLKDAREHLKCLSPDDKRLVISIKIRNPERNILEIIDSVRKADLSRS